MLSPVADMALVLEFGVMRGNCRIQRIEPLRMLWIVWRPIHYLLYKIALLVRVTDGSVLDKIRRANTEATGA